VTETLRIRAGRLLDVVAGEELRDRLVTVREDRIESVDAFDGGTVDLDLSNHTVLPGLIDCHAHLIGELESGHGYAEVVTRSAAQEAMSGVRNARDTITRPGSPAFGTWGRSGRSSTSRSETRSRPATCSDRA